MKKHLLSGILALVVAAGSVEAQTSPKYENYGTVTTPLNIDATAFINGGAFMLDSIGSLYYYYVNFYFIEYPFDTQNTLYYTNLASGTMSNAEGFRFAHLQNGIAYPATVFENRGSIEGYTLRVYADKVIQAGLMDAQGGGLIRMEGQEVNLTRGGLQAVGFGATMGGQSGLTVEYFGLGTNQVMSGRERPLNLSMLSMPNPNSPMHQVQSLSILSQASTSPYVQGSAMVPNGMYPSDFVAIAQTNQVDETNIVIQVLFYNTNFVDTNVFVRGGFRMGFGDAPGDTAVVEWRSPAFNIITGNPYTNYATFFDDAAGMTNVDYSTNAYGEFVQPANYRIYQGEQSYVFGLLTNNAVFANSLIVDPSYSNTMATNFYAAYSANLGPSMGLGVTNLNPALYDPTNLPGRIEIAADRLDLSRARLRAGNYLSVASSNLLSAEGMLVDAPLLNYNFATTKGTLALGTNGIPLTVKRLSGPIWAYTALWTNYSGVILGGGTNATTNVLNLKFHCLILDAQLRSEQPVELDSLVLRDTNIVFNTDVLVKKVFRIDAPNVQINSNLWGNTFTNLTADHFPTVKNFTNNGTITVQNVANFGNDRPTPYALLINRGQIEAQSINLAAEVLDNSGTLSAGYGAIAMRASAAKLDGGALYAGGDLDIKANEIKARSVTVNATTLRMAVTNRLSDGGADANSTWTLSSGFELNVKPTYGDLLGTRFACTAPKFLEVPSRWSGLDRGVSPAGFSDNVALGVLSLDGQLYSTFSFAGTSASNALYVDYLDLQNYTTNYLDGLKIGSNMRLYFAAASVPAESLDGQFDGRLRWVPNYAGANSSTNVTLPDGQVVSVNLSLLQSQAIDSDADGVANASDTSPFDGVKITGVRTTNAPPLTTLISWNAAGRTQYQVTFATNQPATQWFVLTNLLNTATSNRVLTVQDRVVNQEQRFYRISYDAGTGYQPDL